MAGEGMKDGGPAFPRITGVELYASTYAGSPPSVCVQHDEGMSLRDWFAGQALSGLLMNETGFESVAKLAYEYADAMLKARER